METQLVSRLSPSAEVGLVTQGGEKKNLPGVNVLNVCVSPPKGGGVASARSVFPSVSLSLCLPYHVHM